MIPYVSIELDRPRKLRLSMRAMVDFERVTKTKFTQLNDEMGIETIAKLLWVMLKQEDPTLTLEKTIDLCDEHFSCLNDLNNIVTEVMAAAYPKGNGDSKNVTEPTEEN